MQVKQDNNKEFSSNRTDEDKINIFSMFYEKGATRERIKYFQFLITKILEKADLKQEDKSNILEMLKKI